MSKNLKNALFKIGSSIVLGFFLWLFLTLFGVLK